MVALNNEGAWTSQPSLPRTIAWPIIGALAVNFAGWGAVVAALKLLT